MSSIVFIAFLIALMHPSQCIPTFNSTTITSNHPLAVG
uniref:Uncharacterized protein n=1 Tax=Arundo donax TaxID=35708 RepID=A0A0A9ANX8_ARUDO